MGQFNELLRKVDDFSCSGGVSDDAIKEAEERLGLHFSDEYRAFLREIGTCMFDGTSLIGLSDHKGITGDVVSVTEEHRDENLLIPSKLYVIEDTGVESVIILQDESGVVYSCGYRQEPQKESDSLCDFYFAN